MILAAGLLVGGASPTRSLLVQVHGSDLVKNSSTSSVYVFYMSTCLALISKLNSRVCQGLSVQILQKFGRRLSDRGRERLDPYVTSRRAQAFELSLCEEQTSRRREDRDADHW